MAAVANLFGYVLNFLYNAIQNYGLAIILFSVLLKIVLLPFTIKQQKSMKKSAKVQEEMKKLQLKYKNDPEKLNREVMALYKREKMNPLSGCLSSIIQLFIIVSVFYLVSRPLTFMKKIDTNIINDYKNEMTEKGETSSYPEIKIIETKSGEDENVYINMDFLGLNLSKVPMQNLNDFRVYIIPLLYIITSIVNIKLSTAMTKKKKDEKAKVVQKEKDKEELEIVDKKEKKDEETPEEQLESMQQMTNSMNYMMPIMMGVMTINLPAGLGVYWTVSNIIQAGQTIIVTKMLKSKELKLEGAKK